MPLNLSGGSELGKLMRLTLRTLLAYLDDRLAPQQAKEIGQKLTTSPFATDLADRIRSVVRRRRLAKESTGQKTIDANLIAEYLDDQLTPELVALIEKEILTSDHSLAEVAATHQIIGMLNDPVELAEPLKERLYRLGPKPDGDGDEPKASAATDWKPLESQSVKQKRSPMILLGGMVLGWLVLVATDSNLFRGATEGEPAVAGAGQENGDAGIPEDPIDLVDDTTNSEAANAQDSNAGPSETSTDPRDLASAEPATGTSTDAEPKDASSGNGTVSGEPPVGVTDAGGAPMEPNGATPEPPVDVPTPVVVTTDPPAPNPDRIPVSFTVDDPFRMLLRYNPEPSSWSWASEDVSKSSWNETVRDNLLGLPHPFHANVSVLESGWTAVVRGQSLVRFLSNGTGIEMHDGGVVITSAETESRKPFVVQTAGSSFEIELPSDGKRIGVQVMPTPLPIGAEGLAAEQTSFLPRGRVTIVSVFAADTEVTVRINGKAVQLPIGTIASWRSDADAAPVPVAATVPDWIFAITEPVTDSTRELLMNTATTFQKSASVADASEELLESRNPMMAEYAVAIPALTRELDSLCSILLNTEQSGVRRAAIDGLQFSMTTSPGAMDKVAQVMRTRLTEVETSDTVKLLMGVSPVEAEDRFVSEWIVSMLENSRAAMRELAIVNLERLTGSREGFQTDDEATRRSSSVRRWRKRLSRNDGRLLTPQG